MPNPIKYNSSLETDALNVGNFWIGTGDVDKGPTSITGYYNGITPPPNGYTIYVHKLNQGPSIRIASDDSELIEITNHIAGTAYTTIIECFNYFEGQSDKMVTHQTMNFRITDGLVLDLDGNNIPSYPHNGTTWHDLSGESNNGTLTNGPTFDSNGAIVFDGSDDYIDLGSPSSLTLNGGGTITALCKWDSYNGSSWSNTIIGKGYGGWAAHHYILFKASNTNKILFSVSNGSSYLNGSGPYTRNIPLNQWFYVTATWDSTVKKIYYNGNLEASVNSTIMPISSTAPVSIGRTGTNGYYLDGGINSLNLYNRALTQDEILQNYYQAPIVTDGLVFAVDAGNLVSYENGDTTTYSLTGSSTGTLTNGVAFNSGYGGVWEFDGTDDYITLPSSIATSLNGGEEASLNMWVKLNSNSNSVANTGIIQLSGYNSGNGNLYWYQNGYTYLDIFITTRYRVWINTVLDPRNWHMLTITTTPGTNGWKAYLNGILQYQTTGQSTVSVNSTIQGGLTLGENSGGRYTNGNIASCFIYDKALTSDEVSKNYHATKYKFGHI